MSVNCVEGGPSVRFWRDVFCQTKCLVYVSSHVIVIVIQNVIVMLF